MPSIYDIPAFNGYGTNIPSFGGYGPGTSAYNADLAIGAQQPLLAQLGVAGNNARNPNAFYNNRISPSIAFETRKKTGRIYPPAMAALSAENALLAPSLDLGLRAGQGYAGLFGQVAPQYLAGYRAANPDTAALLAQLTQGASALTSPNYTNPYEDRLLTQSIRESQAARGLGYGQSDALAELLALDRAREARTLARGQYGESVVEAGRQYYTPILAGLLSQYQNPVTPTTTSDLLSIGINDTQARRNEHAARIAGNQALWGGIVGSLLGAGGKALGAAPSAAPSASGAALGGNTGAQYSGFYGRSGDIYGPGLYGPSY